MIKIVLTFVFLGLLVGWFWIWSADNWRLGCFIAPLLLVLLGAIATGIIESKTE